MPNVRFVHSIRLIHFALVASSLVLTACHHGSADPDALPSPTALQTSPPGALLNYIQGKLLEQVDKVTNEPYVVTASDASGLGTTSAAGVSSPEIKSFSSTTLQEFGVDEADLMKTDGKRIFSLTSTNTINTGSINGLRVDRRLSDGSLVADDTLALDRADLITGLHLTPSGERVAVLGQPMLANAILGFQPTDAVDRLQTVLELIDAKTGQALARSHRIRVDGALVGSRMVGNTLYLMTTWNPDLYTVPVYGMSTVAERKAAIANLKTADILPTLSVAQADTTKPVARTPLLADTDCYVQTDNASYGVQMTIITAFNLASPTLDRSSRCFLGGTEAVYMSAQNVYLATRRYKVLNQGGVMAYPSQISTDIHKFALNGLDIQYRGSGEVSGHLGWDASKNSYRMSEHKGDLRVLTYTDQFGWFGEQVTTVATATATSTNARPSPAVLSVLRENAAAGKLQTLSTLPNTRRPEQIGLSGEQVYAVRFLGDRGYVVTFRRTDPLYILDLSDPADPKVTGELKASGYSDYLLPAGEGLLVGVGKDATEQGRVQGVKIALFDVADASAPRELATRVFGKTGSTSGLDSDSHGVNLMAVGNTTRMALPVQVNEMEHPVLKGFYCPTYQGLLRFDIDARTRTLTDRPTIITKPFAGICSPEESQNANPVLRSVQVDGYVYYLTGQGQVLGAPW